MPGAPGGRTRPEAVVESLERELLRRKPAADLGRTGVLLHPDFTEIGTSGRIWTRDAMMMALEENPGGPGGPGAAGRGPAWARSTVLLTYRSHSRAGISPAQLPVGPVTAHNGALRVPSGHARGLSAGTAGLTRQGQLKRCALPSSAWA